MRVVTIPADIIVSGHDVVAFAATVGCEYSRDSRPEVGQFNNYITVIDGYQMERLIILKSAWLA